MKKVLLIFILFMMFVCSGYSSVAREPDPYEVDNIPQYKEYFEEYAQRLYDNFQPRKHFIGFTTYDNFWYTIFRDGTVKNIGNFFSDNKYTQYCKDVIMETKPKPFPPEIKDEFIIVDMWFGYKNENEYKFMLYGRTKSKLWLYWQKLYDVESVNVVNISIQKKNYLHKPW